MSSIPVTGYINPAGVEWYEYRDENGIRHYFTLSPSGSAIPMVSGMTKMIGMSGNIDYRWRVIEDPF